MEGRGVSEQTFEIRGTDDELSADAFAVITQTVRTTSLQGAAETLAALGQVWTGVPQDPAIGERYVLEENHEDDGTHTTTAVVIVPLTRSNRSEVQ